MRAVLKPMRESAFWRYRLGQWVDGESAWFGWDDWLTCKNRRVTANRWHNVVLACDGSCSGDSIALAGCT